MPRSPPPNSRRRSSDRHRDRDRDRDRDRERDRERDRRREKSPETYQRRTQHRHTDSATRLLENLDYSSNSPSPTKPQAHRSSRGRRSDRPPGSSSEPFTSRSGSSNPLSADSLARLNAATHGTGWRTFRVSEGQGDVAEDERRRQEDEYDAEKRRQRDADRRARVAERRRRSQQRDTDDRKGERRRQGQRAEVEDYEDRRQQRRTSRRRDTSEEYQRDRKERRRRDDLADERRRVDYSDDDEGVRVYRDVEVVRSSRQPRVQKQTKFEDHVDDRREKYIYSGNERSRKLKKTKERVISGQTLEKGLASKEVETATTSSRSMSNGWGFLAKRGPQSTILSAGELEFRKKRRKRICIFLLIVLLILIIAIPVGVTVSRHKNVDPESNAMRNSTQPSNSQLNGIPKDSIPASAKGTILDPFTWYDTTDFNCTYTDATVGGLYVMGLNSTWDDSVQANPNVPALKDSFAYGTMPIRGINLGGWLSIEPFITPSLFNAFGSRENVIDEYTLTSKLGSSKAASTLEKHYSAFVTRQTFQDMRNAGFDHVRIPFSYWAVTTYPGDPYVPQISWRYLLRGIEWARENGLRVNLDLHGAPGSQNGWNHSGRQGVIGWLNGTDGDLNGQRTLDIHGQLSTFFAQPRYKNVVTMYGLLNEPRMVAINTESVMTWTQKAIDIVQKNNITAIIVMGDGFMGLDNWQGKMQGYKNLVLDAHQYVIFNNDLITMNHHDKMTFACGGWTAQMTRSENTATGFGPTMCGEWSQADTDCAPNLNDLNTGSRWEGTLNTGNATTSVLSPTCPTKNNPRCSCTNANADPSKYSATYKQWLLDFAEAQMTSFEKGWGWFYWTWTTESAPQWSYQAGLAAGILPAQVYNRSFDCPSSLPDYAGMGLPEYY